VPAGPRWGASYAMQLRILFTRCGARHADAFTLPLGSWSMQAGMLGNCSERPADPYKQGPVCCRRASAAALTHPPASADACDCAWAGRWLCGASSRCPCRTSASSSSSACSPGAPGRAPPPLTPSVTAGAQSAACSMRALVPGWWGRRRRLSARADGAAAAAGASGSSAPARARSPPRRTRLVRVAPHAGCREAGLCTPRGAPHALQPALMR